MKKVFLGVIAISTIANAKLEIGQTYQYVSAADGFAYSFKLKDASSGAVSTSLGSSTFKVTKNEDTEMVLSLDKAINQEGYPIKNGNQVHSIATITELKISQGSGKTLKVSESGISTYPDKDDKLPNEKYLNEIDVKEVKPTDLALYVGLQSHIALPVTNEATTGYMYIKLDGSSGTGAVLSTDSDSTLKGNFLYSGKTGNLNQLDSLRIKFSTGDVVEYQGMDQDFGSSEKVVFGTFWSKAQKQTYVFSGRMVFDELYSQKAPGFITAGLVEGTYTDSATGTQLEFKNDGILTIKGVGEEKFTFVLDWSVDNSENLVAVRYNDQNGSMITNPDVVKACRQTQKCAVGQRRVFHVLKVSDDGLVVLRALAMVYSQEEKPTYRMHVQVLKKVD